MITKATREIMKFSEEIDSFKEFLLNIDKKTRRYILSTNEIEPLILYYAFLAEHSTASFTMDIKAIEKYMKDISIENGEKLKAMTSLLKNDRVFTNMFGLSGLIEIFNNKEVSMGSVTPHKASEIAWAFINIVGIRGASNFPFKGNSLKYIQTCIKWDSWEMPPVFFSFPIVMDMFETSQIKLYKSIIPKISNMSLIELKNIGHNIEPSNVITNYLLKTSQEVNYLINKINNVNTQIKSIYELN